MLEVGPPSLPRSHDDLAVLGGVPSFSVPLLTGRPNVLDPQAVVRLVGDAMARDWLTNDGPLVRELEERFAAFQGVGHCVAVSNATLGLQVVARALEITGEVIMPAFTFIGTAHAMQWIGLRPVFCDVSPDTHTLDADAVAGAMTPETGAILGVHLWGQACEVDRLQQVASDRGVPLIFDAAHATGSTYRATPVGRFGRAEVFSLHATKSINGLEGGIVATDDGDLAERLRRLRSFGFVAEDTVAELGINAKMNEFSAAMALANLACYERLESHDAAIHQAYREGLAGLPGITLNESRRGDTRCHHYAVVELSAAPLDRDTLVRVLAAENVVARRYFRPGCHQSPPYNTSLPRHPLPVTERLSASLLQLPTGLQLTPADASRIANVIASACAQGRPVTTALASAPSAA